MAYITQTQIEYVFGTSNVQQWSQLDPTLETTDTTRVAQAIAYAEETINDRFRGSRYTVPFTTVGYVVKDWAAKLAGVWLYQSRGSRGANDANADDLISGHRRAVMEEMDLYLAGQRVMDTGTVSYPHTAPEVVS